MFDVFQLEMTTESIGDGGHLDPAGVGGVKGSNGVGGGWYEGADQGMGKQYGYLESWDEC